MKTYIQKILEKILLGAYIEEKANKKLNNGVLYTPL
jgi:hypothetical protein